MRGDIQLRVGECVRTASEACDGGSDGGGEGSRIRKLGTIQDEDLSPLAQPNSQWLHERF